MSNRAGHNLDQLSAVCALLEPLLERFVLVGGCATGLLITDTGAPEVRATLDVDLIVDVISPADYARLEADLRRLGFQPAMDDAVICRWRHGRYIVDIMPTDETILGFSNPWYKPAIAHAASVTLSNGLDVRHVTAPYFVATKMTAFTGRGDGDFAGSHDMDDLISIVDGRQELLDELRSSDPVLVDFVAGTVGEYLQITGFVDTLPWHLPPDAASQARMPILRQRLESIGALIQHNRPR